MRRFFHLPGLFYLHIFSFKSAQLPLPQLKMLMADCDTECKNEKIPRLGDVSKVLKRKCTCGRPRIVAACIHRSWCEQCLSESTIKQEFDDNDPSGLACPCIDRQCTCADRCADPDCFSCTMYVFDKHDDNMNEDCPRDCPKTKKPILTFLENEHDALRAKEHRAVIRGGYVVIRCPQCQWPHGVAKKNINKTKTITCVRGCGYSFCSRCNAKVVPGTLRACSCITSTGIAEIE